MKISALAPAEVARRLRQRGIVFRIGPVTAHLRSPVPAVAEGLCRLYADYPLEESGGFADFHVAIGPPPNLRRWIRPQAVFSFDGHTPFRPLPLEQAFPMFEWSLNWCVASCCNQYLILHAAVVEKGGLAAILPGPPGAGKSTLCAALVNRGWRLLSDELTLVSMGDAGLAPIPRPVNLKNDSIEIIRRFAPDAVLGRTSHDTQKGSVAHMKPPADSVERADELARPAWVIFPRYEKGAAAALQPRSKAQTFIYAAENSFNYSYLGAKGFDTLGRLMDACDCYDFSYSSLDEAVATFDGLAPPAETGIQSHA